MYIVTNKDYEDQIKDELKDINKENIITEPMNKETATCIGLSAVKLFKKRSRCCYDSIAFRSLH